MVPLENPETVAFTVHRAIESVNPLCVKECEPDAGDSEGRCRQHDNTLGVDTCWVHNVTGGVETCPDGLLSETISVFLCPDSSVQGVLSVAIDTMIPNIPYTDTFALAAGEASSAGSSPDLWLRHTGTPATTADDWSRLVYVDGRGERARGEAVRGPP